MEGYRNTKLDKQDDEKNDNVPTEIERHEQRDKSLIEQLIRLN